MDPEIQDLKQEVEELKELTQDTNRIVHKLRRNIWWGRVWAIAWWLIVAGVGGAAYYYYAQPVIDKAAQYYQSFQHSGNQAQNWGTELGQLFSQYFAHSSTTNTNN